MLGQHHRGLIVSGDHSTLGFTMAEGSSSGGPAVPGPDHAIGFVPPRERMDEIREFGFVPPRGDSAEIREFGFVPPEGDLVETSVPDHHSKCGQFDQVCPMTPCRGRAEPAVCSHWNRLIAWRAVTVAEQIRRAEASTRTSLDPRVRDAVNACEARGSVLPISEQDDCGCRGRELTECRAGRGAKPGRVTLLDCLGCQAAKLFGPSDL